MSRGASTAQSHGRSVGWPRRFVQAALTRAERQGAVKLLPVPWVNGEHALGGRFAQFDSQRLVDGIAHRLCAVCGLHVLCPDVRPQDAERESVGKLGVTPGPLVFMRYQPTNASDEIRAHALSDGPGCCVRCAIMAARFCPHLVDQLAEDPDEIIAFVYHGHDRGIALVPREHSGNTSMGLVMQPYTGVTFAQLRALL